MQPRTVDCDKLLCLTSKNRKNKVRKKEIIFYFDKNLTICYSSKSVSLDLLAAVVEDVGVDVTLQSG